MRQLHWLSFWVGLLLSNTVYAQNSYNYFAPGGALSCSGACTQQSIDLTATGFVLHILPITSGGSGTSTATGTGNLVLATSPTLTAPNLGTPSAINLANATGLPAAALPALSGDCTTPGGSGVITCTQINGVVANTGAGNQVWATPNGSSGAAGFRAITTPDILACATTRIVFDTAGNLVCSAAFTWADSLRTLGLGVAGDGQVNIKTPNGSTGAGTALAVNAGNAGGANANGGDINFQSGTGNGSGRGGNQTLSGGGSNGTGGGFTLQAGSGNNGVNFGGQFLLPGGPASGGTGADVVIASTTGADAAHSGNVIIQDFALDNSFVVDPFGNIVCGCATAANATDQFIYLSTSAAVPTGVPAHTTGSYAKGVPARYDTADNRLYIYNSGWLNVADSPTNKVLAGTTGSIGGGALLAGACATGTATVTGATTAMAITATPVTTPGPGFYESPPYVSGTNTVTVSICAAVAGTPTASAYNVRAQP